MAFIVPVAEAATTAKAAQAAGAAKAGSKAAGAKAGSKAAGGKAAARRAPARGSGSTPVTKPEHIPTTDEVDAGVTSADLEAASPAPAPTSSGTGAAGVVMPAAASTGSGFLLGVFAWALGLAYLRGGGSEVRRFMAAKFLNKTEG